MFKKSEMNYFNIAEPDIGECTQKNSKDSDSDSEMSIGQGSLDLASSISSDEDDDYVGLKWDQQLPKNETVGKYT